MHALAEDPEEATVPNIGVRERRRRFRLGITGLAVGGTLIAGDLALGLPPAGRLVAALLVFGGFAGLFQARGKT